MLSATTHLVTISISLQSLLYFIDHYGHANNLEISEKAAMFLVLKPLQEYAVILHKTIKCGILGHRKGDSNIPAAAA